MKPSRAVHSLLLELAFNCDHLLPDDFEPVRDVLKLANSIASHLAKSHLPNPPAHLSIPALSSPKTPKSSSLSKSSPPKPKHRRIRQHPPVQTPYNPKELTSLRVAKGLSQSELARAINVHFTSISKAERGLGCSLAILERLAYFFKVPIAQLELPIPPQSARLIKQGNALDPDAA
jgi:DNA-binding XRE family transcriptional regulator